MSFIILVYYNVDLDNCGFNSNKCLNLQIIYNNILRFIKFVILYSISRIKNIIFMVNYFIL